MSPLRTRFADEPCHRRHSSPGVVAPSRPVLVHAETFPRSQAMEHDLGKRHFVLDGLVRLLPCFKKRASSLDCSSPRSPQPPTLATLRDEHKAKKMEKIVQARAMMKQRLVDYCVVQAHHAQLGDTVA